MAETQTHFWGPLDSNMDWCEPNYAYTPYLAELWNTLSSIPISMFAAAGWFYGMSNGLKNKRYALAFLGMICVGLGSAAFHATLRRFTQSLDELPMLYTVIVFNFICIDNVLAKRRMEKLVASNPHHKFDVQMSIKRDRPHRNRLAVYGVLYAIVATLLYFSPTFGFAEDLFILFFVLYGSAVAHLTLRVGYEIGAFSSSAHRFSIFPIYSSRTAEDHNHTLSENVPFSDFRYSPKIIRLYNLSSFCYFFGFACWVMDLTVCKTVAPQTFFLHSVWHIMAGFGSYLAIEVMMAWRAELYHRAQTYIDHICYVPYVTVKFHH